MYHDYKKLSGPLKRLAMIPLIHYLRLWDTASAQRVDHFVANSKHVAKRIEKIYRRDAAIIHPPVNIEDFSVSAEPDDFYLMVGQLVGYKRADLAIRAFNRIKKRLIVIGQGEQFKMLKKIAGPGIELMGWQPFSVVREHYSKCRALIFPGEEDFGIVPVEAMASGRPVIAYGRGGALETIVEGETGIFFNNQSEEDLISAIDKFESNQNQFKPIVCRSRAKEFNIERFQKEFLQFVEQHLP
jgi:glycosyltransferase involved in cell wall biosynthesis